MNYLMMKICSLSICSGRVAYLVIRKALLLVHFCQRLKTFVRWRSLRNFLFWKKTKKKRLSFTIQSIQKAKATISHPWKDHWILFLSKRPLGLQPLKRQASRLWYTPPSWCLISLSSRGSSRRVWAAPATRGTSLPITLTSPAPSLEASASWRAIPPLMVPIPETLAPTTPWRSFLKPQNKRTKLQRAHRCPKNSTTWEWMKSEKKTSWRRSLRRKTDQSSRFQIPVQSWSARIWKTVIQTFLCICPSSGLQPLNSGERQWVTAPSSCDLKYGLWPSGNRHRWMFYSLYNSLLFPWSHSWQGKPDPGMMSGTNAGFYVERLVYQVFWGKLM